MPRPLVDIQAVNLLRQEVHQVMADINRRLLDLDQQLEAMLPPEDDRRDRAARRRPTWRGFLDGKKAGTR